MAELATQEAPKAADRIGSYGAFWPYYLREHAKPGTRQIHYVGTTLMLLAFATFIVTGNVLWLLATPIAGYGFAWVGHFFIEHNRPATFKYPLWSFISDLRMYFTWLAGRLAGELKSAGV